MNNFDEFNRIFEMAKENFKRTNILVLGKTGVGKSTLINAIFGEDLAKTGTGKPCTENIKEYSKILEKAISNGIKIYNDAYISCANKAFGYNRKHDNHLALLNKMFNEDKIQDKIIKCNTMEEAFNIIKSYPLIGNFMAYQLVTDINYSEVVNWKEDEFTVAGPGSLRGIKKCFIDKGKMTNEDIIRYMYEHQDEEFKRLNLDFKKIGNRPLQLIDCQNIFCELDKYCRKALPDLKSNRTKIKKHYVPKNEKIEYIYPLKWKI